MADINVPLLVALGDRAAPQHKVRGQDAFEFAEGSDGALHTKIVDQNGNPISSSNKLQVADTDVKAELEQIKQTQQEILERLNQPIDTQLTGSYVKEIVIVKGLEISAGSSAFIGVQNLEDAEYLSFAIRSGKAHNFVATAQRRTSDGLFLDYSPTDRLQLLNVTNKSVALSDRFPVTAPVMMFVVQNNSTETQTYDAYLYKIGSKVM